MDVLFAIQPEAGLRNHFLASAFQVRDRNVDVVEAAGCTVDHHLKGRVPVARGRQTHLSPAGGRLRHPDAMQRARGPHHRLASSVGDRNESQTQKRGRGKCPANFIDVHVNTSSWETSWRAAVRTVFRHTYPVLPREENQKPRRELKPPAKSLFCPHLKPVGTPRPGQSNSGCVLRRAYCDCSTVEKSLATRSATGWNPSTYFFKPNWSHDMPKDFASASALLRSQ